MPPVKNARPTEPGPGAGARPGLPQAVWVAGAVLAIAVLLALVAR